MSSSVYSAFSDTNIILHSNTKFAIKPKSMIERCLVDQRILNNKICWIQKYPVLALFDENFTRFLRKLNDFLVPLV